MNAKHDIESIKAASLAAITSLNVDIIDSDPSASTRHLQETVIDISEEHNVDSALLFGFVLKCLNASSHFLTVLAAETLPETREDIRAATQKIAGKVALSYDINADHLLQSVSRLNPERANNI